VFGAGDPIGGASRSVRGAPLMRAALKQQDPT